MLSPIHRRKTSKRRSAFGPFGRKRSFPQAAELLKERCMLTASSVFPELRVDSAHYDTSTILVQIQDDVISIEVAALFGDADFRSSFRSVPGLFEVTVGPGMDVNHTVEFFRSHASVILAEPNYRIQLESFSPPNDPSYGQLWALNNTGQNSGTNDADIDAFEAWAVTTGSSSTLVAVIDTGVDYTHPDLAANIWTNTAEIAGNGIDDDGNGFVDDIHGYDFINNDGDPIDDHGHARFRYDCCGGK